MFMLRVVEWGVTVRVGRRRSSLTEGAVLKTRPTRMRLTPAHCAAVRRRFRRQREKGAVQTMQEV